MIKLSPWLFLFVKPWFNESYKENYNNCDKLQLQHKSYNDRKGAH